MRASLYRVKNIPLLTSNMKISILISGAQGLRGSGAHLPPRKLLKESSLPRTFVRCLFSFF
jgi:hypothetical protein